MQLGDGVSYYEEGLGGEVVAGGGGGGSLYEPVVGSFAVAEEYGDDRLPANILEGVDDADLDSLR